MTLSGHLFDTPEPKAQRHPVGHSLGHPHFRGHPVGHSPGHFGPEGPGRLFWLVGAFPILGRPKPWPSFPCSFRKHQGKPQKHQGFFSPCEPLKTLQNKQKTLKNTKETPRKKNTKETKTLRKRRTGKRGFPPNRFARIAPIRVANRRPSKGSTASVVQESPRQTKPKKGQFMHLGNPENAGKRPFSSDILGFA